MKSNPFFSRVQHLLPISAIAALVVLSTGCSLLHRSEPASPAAVSAIRHVEVTPAAMKQIADPVQVPAEIVSAVSVDVSAQVGGQVDQLLVKRGDYVQMGEPIIKLSSGELQTARDQAALAVQAAQDQLAQAKAADQQARQDQQAKLAVERKKAAQEVDDRTKAYNKVRNDYDDGQATQSDVDQAKAALDDAKRNADALAQGQGGGTPSNWTGMELDLQNAQLTLQRAEQALDALVIKAPISGLLTDLTSIEPGLKLQAGAKIGVVQKLDPIRIRAELSASNAKLMSGKKTAQFLVAGSTKEAQAQVLFLSEVADPQTGLFELDLEAANADNAIKPGMRAQVVLSSEQDVMALSVPTYSVIHEGQDAYVFVVANGVAVKRKVQLGRVNEPNQEVLAGMKEGERVVTSGLGSLKDGDAVQVDNG